MAEAEERTEQAIKVREVTNIHSNWDEQERGEPGKTSFQLILDDGADEYVLRPPATGGIVKMLNDLLRENRSKGLPLYFDMERKVLIFGTVHVGGVRRR